VCGRRRTVTALSDNGTTLRLRPVGIDAAEVAHDKKPDQRYGEAARDSLDHLIGGKTIRVDACRPDQCTRVLGVL
jgi:endonuclease YncB( thermonuclease family)